MARPVEYTPDVVDKCYEYFTIPDYKKETKIFTDKFGKPVEIEVNEAPDFPSIAGFAASLYRSKSTIYEWAKKYPELSVALDWAREQQEELLLRMGLKQKYSASMTKFVLINNHKYKEKLEQDIDVKQPISINLVRDN